MAALTLHSLTIGARPAGGHRPRASRQQISAAPQLVRRVVINKRAGERGPQVLRATEVEDIDPMTGDVITEKSSSASIAGETVTAGGLTFAYRTAELNADKAAALSVPNVLFVHGLGSSSYGWRNTLELMAADGVRVFAADLPGHGGSSKPSPGSQFDYSEKAYKDALSAMVEALPISKPFVLGVQGFVTSQYALLWALEHPDLVDRLLILNTPLNKKSKLRPELAAYKNPVSFLRPATGKRFDAMTFNAAGSPYAMAYRDAQAYDLPYEQDPAASVALAETMAKLDFADLCSRVDEGYCSWRKPSLLVWGASDPFLNIRTAFDFLDSKRTCMRMAQFEAKLGHCPQEDYAEAIHPVMMEFLKADE